MFGQKLQQLRVNAGLSLGELAQKAGVSIKTLEGWVLGAGEPGSGALSKLANALGVPQDELTAGLSESQQIRERQVVSAPRERPQRPRGGR